MKGKSKSRDENVLITSELQVEACGISTEHTRGLPRLVITFNMANLS